MFRPPYTVEEIEHLVDLAANESTSGVLIDGEPTQEYKDFISSLRFSPQTAVNVLRQLGKGVTTTFAEQFIAYFLRIDPRSDEPRWVYIASPTMVDRVNRFREFEEHHRADDTSRRSYRDQEAVALVEALNTGIDGKPLDIETEEIFDPINKMAWKLLARQRDALHGEQECRSSAPQYWEDRSTSAKPGCTCDADLLQPLLFGDYTDIYGEYGTWVRRSYEQGLYCKLNRALVHNSTLVNGRAVVVVSLKSAVTDFVRRRAAKGFTRPDLLLKRYNIQHDDEQVIAEVLLRQCSYTNPLSKGALIFAIQEKLNTLSGADYNDINGISTEQVLERLKDFYVTYPEIADLVRPRLQERAALQMVPIVEEEEEDQDQKYVEHVQVIEESPEIPDILDTDRRVATHRKILRRIESVYRDVRSKYRPNNPGGAVNEAIETVLRQLTRLDAQTKEECDLFSSSIFAGNPTEEEVINRWRALKGSAEFRSSLREFTRELQKSYELARSAGH